MAKNTVVIICEKPSVAKEYAKCLGIKAEGKNEGYIEGDSGEIGEHCVITWTVGHLVTLSYPEAYGEEFKKWSLETLPFLPEEYKYEVISSVSKQFGIVKKLYHRADIGKIMYAGDSGREGLYIQMLVRMVAGVKSGVDEKVVWIDSQTKEEILKGIRTAKPVSAYDNLKDAAYMRAIEDYVIGINFSRVLTIKYGDAIRNPEKKKSGAIAVGRVMTCVLGMIVAREREIANFKESLYYGIKAHAFDRDLNWKPSEEQKKSPLMYNDTGFKNRSDAEALKVNLDKDKTLTIKSVEVKEKKESAPLLFNLAELQFWCTKKYHISPDETLAVAQSLYEKKVTTYPRTDARVLTTAMAKEINKNLAGLSAGDIHDDVAAGILKNAAGLESYLVKSKYVDDSKVTDHYAIIPTGQQASLTDLEEKVYTDIVERFLSIFLPAAVYEEGKLLAIHSSGESFTGSAKTLKSPGYLKILSGKMSDEDEDVMTGDNPFHKLKNGDKSPAEFEICERKTEPPNRYTSGSMILAMENAGKLVEDEELREQIKSCGIGTSATRAGIIAKLAEKNYISINKKTQILKPTEDGEKIYDIVDETIPSLLKPDMTASWEKGLSGIENGNVKYSVYLSKINEYVTNVVEKVKKQEGFKGGPKTTQNRKGVEIAVNCPLCREGVIVKNSFKGKTVYGCSKYKETGCAFALWATDIKGVNLTDNQALSLINHGHTGIIRGFKKKDGSGTFDAVLRMKPTGKLEFDFDFQDKKKP